MALPLAGTCDASLEFLQLDSAGAVLYVGAYIAVGFLFHNFLASITRGLNAASRHHGRVAGGRCDRLYRLQSIAIPQTQNLSRASTRAGQGTRTEAAVGRKGKHSNWWTSAVMVITMPTPCASKDHCASSPTTCPRK